MGHREAAGLEFGEQRLDVAQRRLAGRRIAHVTDRGPAGEAVDRRGAGEMIAHQPLAALGVESRAVEGDDARGFLTAMLERMQTQRDDRRRVGVAENAEDAARLVQPVVLEIDARGVGCVGVHVDGGVLVRLAPGRRPRACQCLGTFAGAGGAGGGTFLLIRASSFCLSIVDPSAFFCDVGGGAFASAGAGVASG